MQPIRFLCKDANAYDIGVLLKSLPPNSYLTETPYGICAVDGVTVPLRKIRDDGIFKLTNGVFTKNDVPFRGFTELSTVGTMLLHFALIKNTLYLKIKFPKVGRDSYPVETEGYIEFYH